MAELCNTEPLVASGETYDAATKAWSPAAPAEELYDVVPELRAGAARHDSLRYGARIELRDLNWNAAYYKLAGGISA